MAIAGGTIFDEAGYYMASGAQVGTTFCDNRSFDRVICGMIEINRAAQGDYEGKNEKGRKYAGKHVDGILSERDKAVHQQCRHTSHAPPQ